MKKILLAAVMLSVAMLAACDKNETPSETPQPTPTATVQPTAEPVELIQAGEESKVLDGWSEMAKYRFDIDGDGERETIRLYTDAAQSDDGVMEWDDGHNWVLEMTDASNIFTLYEGYIQLGTPNLRIYEDADGQNCIALDLSMGAGYEIKKFVYIKDKKAFEAHSAYKEEGINLLYESAPLY